MLNVMDGCDRILGVDFLFITRLPFLSKGRELT